MEINQFNEKCSICGCNIHRKGDYAKPTVQGRSHATKHHFVAERFFGRSANRPGEHRDRIFQNCPWNVEGKTAIYCYECHEELLHNPVLLPKDVEILAEIVRLRGLNENVKTESRRKISERIKLVHEIIANGLEATLQKERKSP